MPNLTGAGIGRSLSGLWRREFANLRRFALPRNRARKARRLRAVAAIPAEAADSGGRHGAPPPADERCASASRSGGTVLSTAHGASLSRFLPGAAVSREGGARRNLGRRLRKREATRSFPRPSQVRRQRSVLQKRRWRGWPKAGVCRRKRVAAASFAPNLTTRHGETTISAGCGRRTEQGGGDR